MEEIGIPMADGPPRYQLSRDELHTTRQNLSDEHTVVDGPPWYQLSRDELHNTRQNLSCEHTVVDGPPNTTTNRYDKFLQHYNICIYI